MQKHTIFRGHKTTTTAERHVTNAQLRVGLLGIRFDQRDLYWRFLYFIYSKTLKWEVGFESQQAEVETLG